MTIEIEIAILGPELSLRLPASEDGLPVIRQAMRSLGETVDADSEALEDAELAVTEACANAVEHAYAGGEGDLHVSFAQEDRRMRVSVRDFGAGMPTDGGVPAAERGFGLSLIESIAETVEVRGGGGTELAMAFDMGDAVPATVDGGAPGLEPAERILRRVVAVVGAQADLATDRLTEALLVAELVARHGLRRLVGDRVRVRVERTDAVIRLRVGPLESDGARALIADTEVPVLGPIVERLADRLEVERDEVDGVPCEYLVVGLRAAGD